MKLLNNPEGNVEASATIAGGTNSAGASPKPEGSQLDELAQSSPGDGNSSNS